ncbi:MAG: type III-A CRISPR-associated protein Cas10/Csm1 [Acidobacteriota bacterium]
MLIIGKLSGIQNYLFDVAHEGGGQARRLRARSFFIQLLVETAAQRVLYAINWPQQRLQFCNAGKFLLEGDDLNVEQQNAFNKTGREISSWLLEETNSDLHFSLVAQSGEGKLEQHYYSAMKQLARKEKQAWVDVVTNGQSWQVEKLILPSLDEPCELCRHRQVECNEDEDGVTRHVCRQCFRDREIGKLLPTVKWAVLSPHASQNSFNVCGWHVTLTVSLPVFHQREIVLSLEAKQNGNGNATRNFIKRRLMPHIPLENNRPIEFVELAKKSRGDQLLGVLKMDGDKFGSHIKGLFQGTSGLNNLTKFSYETDEFFAGTLTNLMKKEPWNLMIYTIFSGGDDLLLVGPWDVIFDFAGVVQQKFYEQFNNRGLTLSGGMAFIKPKHPVRFAAKQAEELLEKAKNRPAPNAQEGRNQLAAFGQIWKWWEHKIILNCAHRLVELVDKGVMQRGWLQTLLRLSEMRLHSRTPADVGLAAARLAHTVARNYPRRNDPNQERVALRQWADNLIADFEHGKNVETRYLSAIIRYALTATRIQREEKSYE